MKSQMGVAGFEPAYPKESDLQSNAIGHYATPP
jgi:hypothetical protein